jgi:hypothetical protein
MAKRIVKKAKTIVSFIQQHHVPLTICRHYETNLMLLNPIETRFATIFLMVKGCSNSDLSLSKLLLILIEQLLSTHCMAVIVKSCLPR